MIPTLLLNDDYVLKVEVTEDTLPIDIQGDVIFFTIKRDIGQPDEDAAYQLIETMVADEDTAAGLFYTQMPIQIIQLGTFVYDVQIKRLTSGNGEIQTLDAGSFSVIQDITRALS